MSLGTSSHRSPSLARKLATTDSVEVALRAAHVAQISLQLLSVQQIDLARSCLADVAQAVRELETFINGLAREAQPAPGKSMWP